MLSCRHMVVGLNMFWAAKERKALISLSSKGRSLKTGSLPVWSSKKMVAWLPTISISGWLSKKWIYFSKRSKAQISSASIRATYSTSTSLSISMANWQANGSPPVFRKMENLQTWIFGCVSFEDFAGFICWSIVDGDDEKVAECLIQYRIQAFGQISFGTIGRQNNGEFHICFRCVLMCGRRRILL